MDRSGDVLVHARGLRKDYGKGPGLVRAVDHVDLEVARGEAVAVRGPSGCGKSTLLHLLGGLDRPTAGELHLSGRRIDRLSERALAQLRRHEVGFVFQAFHLMDELTAQENVELPALLAGRSPAGGAAGAPANSSSGSGSPTAQVTCPRRSQEASGNGSPSPAPLPTDRPSCSPTNPPATSTAPPPSRCSGSSRPCTKTGSRSSSSPTTSRSRRPRTAWSSCGTEPSSARGR